MTNIILAICLAVIILIPIIVGAIIFKRKRNFKTLIYSVILNIIFATSGIYLTLIILNPTQEFKKSVFEDILSENFETKFPVNLEYVATQFRQDRGLLSCKYWTARITTDTILYNTFLEEIKNDNWGEKINISDELTGQKISNNFKSRYMSGINYEIDFFEDNQTIRIYIIDCP